MDKGPSLRVLKVQKEVSHLVGEYLHKGWTGYRPAIVSVRSVDMTPDLRTAKIYLSLLAVTEEEMARFRAELENQGPAIQRFVSKSLPMKFSPRLKFVVGSESI